MQVTVTIHESWLRRPDVLRQMIAVLDGLEQPAPAPASPARMTTTRIRRLGTTTRKPRPRPHPDGRRRNPNPGPGTRTPATRTRRGTAGSSWAGPRSRSPTSRGSSSATARSGVCTRRSWSGPRRKWRTRTGSPAGSKRRPADRAVSANAPGRGVRAIGLGMVQAQAPQPVDRRATADLQSDLARGGGCSEESQGGSVVNANPARPVASDGPVAMESHDSHYADSGGRYRDSREGVTDLPGTVPTFQGGNRRDLPSGCPLEPCRIPAFSLKIWLPTFQG